MNLSLRATLGAEPVVVVRQFQGIVQRGHAHDDAQCVAQARGDQTAFALGPEVHGGPLCGFLGANTHKGTTRAVSRDHFKRLAIEEMHLLERPVAHAGDVELKLSQELGDPWLVAYPLEQLVVEHPSTVPDQPARTPPHRDGRRKTIPLSAFGERSPTRPRPGTRRDEPLPAIGHGKYVATNRARESSPQVTASWISVLKTARGSDTPPGFESLPSANSLLTSETPARGRGRRLTTSHGILRSLVVSGAYRGEAGRRDNRHVIELSKLVTDFATGVQRADQRRPQAVGSRSGLGYQPGIGPHTEAQTIKLVVNELAEMDPAYSRYALGVPYPGSGRQRCDWCLGVAPDWVWVIEAKLLRLFGDNGKLNDNMLMHVLSPYPAHRSALTDCDKLAASTFAGRKAIMIVGYDYDQWHVHPAIEAFETLARRRVSLGEQAVASFARLIHPVHQRGAVFAWEVRPTGP